MQTGRITKALSGFYYVTTDDNQTYQTRARGVFRNQDISPYVGDYVEFSLDENEEGTIQAILERKNQLSRPQVVNVEVGCVVTSAVEPAFNTQLLDRFLVQLEAHHIQPAILVTKLDLIDQDAMDRLKDYQAYYQSLGYPFILVDQDNLDATKKALSQVIQGQLAVFMGQSGVGKSTLLNAIDPSLNFKTAETSKALGRGRHTTRHVELVAALGGLIADTPGFSALEFADIEKESLRECFPECWERRAACKFRGCLHYKEPKCAVKQAVASGDMLEERYAHYILFLEEIINRKPVY